MTVRKANRSGSFRQKEKFLFCFVLLLGLFLVLLIPPFDSPDELTHFQNVWAIGHGQAFSEEYWAEGKLSLPAGFAPLMNEYPVRLIGIANHDKCSWADLFRQSAAYQSTGEMMPVEGRIFSFGYLFSALGMALGSAVGSLFGIPLLSSPYIQLLLGRMANWIVFVLVVFASLRKEQPFRKTLFLLATMPMTLFLAATLSYDAILIPVSFYMFASVLSLSENGIGEIPAAEYLRLVLCTLFICGIKAPYACLMLLFLLLPRNALGTDSRRRTQRRFVILLAALTGLVLASVPYLVPAGGAVGYSAEQRDWLMAHPLALPGILLKTLWVDAVSLIIGFWGCYGWLDLHFPRIWTVIGGIVLLGVAVFECCSFPSSGRRRKRLPGLIATILVYSILCTLQYISHAPKANGGIIGGDQSYGFQGRYLIPCFLPFMLTFANSSLSQKKPKLVSALKNKLTWIIICWGICCYLLGAVTLLTRYWI